MRAILNLIYRNGTRFGWMKFPNIFDKWTPKYVLSLIAAGIGGGGLAGLGWTTPQWAWKIGWACKIIEPQELDESTLLAQEQGGVYFKQGKKYWGIPNNTNEAYCYRMNFNRDEANKAEKK